MSVPVPEDIRAEAHKLRAMLEDNVPSYAATRREVSMAPDESAHLRAFWGVVGWCPFFGSWIGDPELSRAPAQAERSMKEWRSWGGAFRLTLDDLPRRFRLAQLDHQGVGFSITDESASDVADPPLLAVSADEGTITPHAPSYLRFVGTSLLMAAVQGWYSTTVMCRPGVLDLPGSVHPFPLLAPGVVALSDALWVLPTHSLFESPGTTFVHSRYEALLEWLANTVALEAVRIPRLPGRVTRLEGTSLAQVDAAIPERRVLEGIEPGSAYRVGALDGVQVLVRSSASGLIELAHNARFADAVQRSLSARGLLKP
ncbi:hypothetical protein [Myxococcus stipitatus]|uniref:hypothetical protein n=1 Tax=Myxococcus stipitatus TaxID=83455 RepID=UPI0030CAD73C